MADQNIISIYKIDRDNDFFEGSKTHKEIIKKIVDRGNLKIDLKQKKARNTGAEFADYESLSVNLQNNYGFTVELYHSQRTVPNAWNDFLAPVLAAEDRKRLQNRNHDFIVFVYNTKDIFCFTGGIASNLVDDICDRSFPKELMIRLSDPEKIKQAKSRGLTGAFYARELYFRGDYSITPTESFGSVWKDVRASIREAVRKDPDWITLLGEKTARDLNCDIKNSFKLRKRVSFSNAVKLAKKFDDELKRALTPEEKRGFYFLNTIEIIKNKQEKEILMNRIVEEAYAFLSNRKGVTFDYDFCHVDYANFLEADKYVAKVGNSYLKEWEETPTAAQILFDLKAAFDMTTLESFKNDIKNSVQIVAECNADKLKNTRGSILDHLHGEIQVGAKIYFLIDKEWCLIKDEFLKVLSKEFKDYIKSDIFCNIPLELWGEGLDEGPYNELHLGKTDFLVADRITINGIELFDLLYWDKKHLYIIQVKDGLGASTRDACSQLRNSARLIEESLKEGEHQKLKDFYGRLSSTKTSYTQKPEFKKQLKGIGTEQKFIELFQNKKIIYVLASRYGNTPPDITKTRSNIAKFEILGLKDSIKQTDGSFMIHQIKKV